MNTDPQMDILLQDYLDMCENYGEKGMSPPKFGFCLISWTVKMLYQTAPTGAAARELIKEATSHGKQSCKTK